MAAAHERAAVAAALAVGATAIGYLPTGVIAVGFALVGVGNGLIDVYLNVAAQRAEVATRRPVLQWLHASYALGGVTGAAVGGTDPGRGARLPGRPRVRGGVPRPHRHVERAHGLDRAGTRGGGDVFSLSALFALARRCGCRRWSCSSRSWWRARWTPGRGCTCATARGAGPVAAIAFIAFAGATSSAGCSRGASCSAWDRAPRSSSRAWARRSAACIAVATDQLWLVGFAFLSWASRSAPPAPPAFGLVEYIDEDPTNAIAAVTTVGYTGFIWSPPLLGYIAETVEPARGDVRDRGQRRSASSAWASWSRTSGRLR